MNDAKADAKLIFLEALGYKGPDERDRFLERACGLDAGLRGRVEELLRAHQDAGNFLGKPDLLEVTRDEHMAECPGSVIGPYKLMEEIGAGGFGLVFVAEQQQPVRRKVALKVIKPGMDSREVIARFEAERQALALMDHPNIAHVFEGGTTPSGRPYFVMELVRGVPMTAFCDQNQLSVRERLELFVTVCQAVQHAHQKGIIHRDLKPSNIMVSLHDDKPVVKVIDFGVAKAVGQQLTEKTVYTRFTQMIGTPQYMSPEQAGTSGLDIDTRTDIYALGVLLYELLTGTTPFDKDRLRTASYEEIRRIIREEDPPKPSTRFSTLGQVASTVSANRKSDPKRLSQLFRGELDWIVMKALEKDRNRRYESASAFAADVQRYLNDEPVLACPPSAAYRFRKFARRNKRALATVGVFTLAVLLALGSLIVSKIRILGEAEEKAKALSAAKASEQEAMENLKDALAAVDQMLTRVSEERLQDMPHMEPVRRDLLQDALQFYQKFLEKRGNDPAIRREAGLAYLRMGSLHYRFGDYRKAEDSYYKGFAMLDELATDSPLAPAVLTKVIGYHIQFSWPLGNQAKYAEQEKTLRQAVGLAETLRQQFPQVPSYRHWLTDSSNYLAKAIARSKPAEAEKIFRRNLDLTENGDSLWHRGQTYHDLGVFLMNRRRLPEAEQACRQGVLFFEKAVAQWPTQQWMQVDLAETLKHLARVMNENGKPQEAEKIYRRVIPLIDKFAADFPAGPHYRWGQMSVHFFHAPLLKKLKQFAAAETEYRRVAELAQKLADDFPTLPGYKWTAVDRRRDLAEFLAEMDRISEAQQVYAGAAPMLEKLTPPERAKALKARGDFYGRLGEWDKATADFAKAIELGAEDVWGVWYPLAVLHLHGQRTKEYHALCEQLLKQLGESDQHFVVVICKLAPDAVADLSRPVQIAERLVARQPHNAELVGILGAALYRKGDLEAAAGKLEAAIRGGPGQVGVYYRKLSRPAEISTLRSCDAVAEISAGDHRDRT
jgi:serine/threonine protein kinase